MKPERILLIRHGQSFSNLDLSIHATVPDYKIELTDRGKIQALDAGEKIKQILDDNCYTRLAVYNSPFYRTRQTLDMIKNFISDYVVSEYEDARLREQEYGHLRGLEEQDKIEKERNEYGRFYFRIPDGESGADVLDRQAGFLETLYRDFQDEDYPPCALIVGHGFQMRILLMKWLHWSVEEFESKRNLKNCEILNLILDGNKYRLLEDLKDYNSHEG